MIGEAAGGLKRTKKERVEPIGEIADIVSESSRTCRTTRTSALIEAKDDNTIAEHPAVIRLNGKQRTIRSSLLNSEVPISYRKNRECPVCHIGRP